MAINRITLKKSLTYNMGGKNFINGPFPTTWCVTPCNMYKARCKSTKAKIQKANVM